MKYSAFSSLFPCIMTFFLFSVSWGSPVHISKNDFFSCLSHRFPNSTSNIERLIYSPNDPSFIRVLDSSIMNFRFSYDPTPKPLLIITPTHASQVQATVICSKNHGIQIRTRSGGHDSDGLSYLSKVPYIIIDLRNLRSIKVNVEKETAWLQAGATLGEVYYSIANKSGTLGFPAGVCYTVGVGGHFSGGGYGILMRKYGLAADNVVDAHLVNAEGKLLNRKSMGEDLFWALRGGGAASFGVVLAWKIRLVRVPPKLTIFSLQRDYEKIETKKLVYRWQYIADKLDDDLLVFVRLQTLNSSTSQGNKITLQAFFFSVFLGGIDRLLPLIEKRFPELGLTRKDCTEMSWIQSALFFNGFPSGSPPEVLLNRTQSVMFSFKAKSDYIKEPIPENVLEKLAETLYQEEVGTASLQLFPYGGKMKDIPEWETPFPHRAGNLYELSYLARWVEKGNATETQSHINWTRRTYAYMAPYVSKNPREAYYNYRDLDLGNNSDVGTVTYPQASIWGTKYFKDNFKRLVYVKTLADPTNFFRNEQSIPPFVKTTH